MPKIIMPFQGLAAAGKNGRSSSSLIFARTKANVEAQKMVTYTKSYKVPVQPDSPSQLFCRGKFKELMDCLRAYNSEYVYGSLKGIPFSESGTFVSDRSLYISNCLKTYLLFFCKDSLIDKDNARLVFSPFLDYKLNEFLSFSDIYFACQVRGNPPINAYYRERFSLKIESFDNGLVFCDRQIYRSEEQRLEGLVGAEFTLGNFYRVRYWFSQSPFPDPPPDTNIDATNTWDIPGCVRFDRDSEAV